MKSNLYIPFLLICSLFLVFFIPGITNAQERNDQVPEAELEERVLRFALEEYNRAIEYGRSAGRVQPPSNRKNEYRQMNQSFEDATRLFETMEEKPREYSNIPSIQTHFWANEHNSGVKLMTDEEARQTVQNPDEAAKAHFENAIIIQPDSAITYAVYASLTLHMEDTLAATRLYEKAMERRRKPSVEEYDFLIDLYFVQDRHDESAELAKEAREIYPEEVIFIQYLADAYLNLGEIDEATAMIRELTRIDPENPRYYLILGTSIYQHAFDYVSKANDLYGQAWEMEEEADQLEGTERRQFEQRIQRLEIEAAEKEQEGDSLIDTAIEEVQKAAELNPDNDEIFNLLGMIYQNRAGYLFEKRDRSSDVMQAMELDEEARITLYEAMENYEKAAEINPDKQEYWETLYRIYMELGMEARVDEIMENLDL